MRAAWVTSVSMILHNLNFICVTILFQPCGKPSSDMSAFREKFGHSKHIVVLTGAGVSAESGVPTFRGAGGFWRKWQAQVKTIAGYI